MQIEKVTAQSYVFPATAPLIDRRFHLPLVLVQVETKDGQIGTGVCNGGETCAAMAQFINGSVNRLLAGENPIHNEKIWQLLYSRYNMRGLSGFSSSVASAIDVALWDIKGKYCRLPVAALLGGAAAGCPTYVTFGLSEYSIEQLVEAARMLVGQGHRRLKMVVGGVRHAVAGEQGNKRNQVAASAASIREDSRRVHAVRDAVGPEAELMIDGNCAFTTEQAIELAAMVEECDIHWFEEPVKANLPESLAKVRAKTRIPVAAGQNIGLSWDHCKLIATGAVDIAQPGVTTVGGFTEAVKVAAIAHGHNVSLSSGGGWAHHNLHLHSGVVNGGYLEHHWLLWQSAQMIFPDLPGTENGWMNVPSAPGLGFEPRPASELREFVFAG